MSIHRPFMCTPTFTGWCRKSSYTSQCRGGSHEQAYTDPSCVPPLSPDGVGSLPTHLSAEEVHMSKHTQTLHVYPHFHRMV